MATLARGRAVQIKRAEITEAGTFSGYASVFNVRDQGDDIVLPGAYKASIAARTSGELAPVRMLFNHDQKEVVGVWDEIVEDDHGLMVKGHLVLEVGRAREIHALMKAGALDGLSIGYEAVDHEKDRTQGVRLLKELALWEISVVTFPMCAPSRIEHVKTAAPPARDSGAIARLAAAVARRDAALRGQQAAGSRQQV